MQKPFQGATLELSHLSFSVVCLGFCNAYLTYQGSCVISVNTKAWQKCKYSEQKIKGGRKESTGRAEERVQMIVTSILLYVFCGVGGGTNGIQH